MAMASGGERRSLGRLGSSGMLGCMTVLKIAVTLPEPLVAHVRKQVPRGRAASVSAYVAEALAQKAESDDLAAMLEEQIVVPSRAPSGLGLTERSA